MSTDVAESLRAADSTGPVRQSERIESLDVLRGFALLGILVMNIQAFAMIFPAYMNPTAYGDLTGLNYWTWYFSHLLADQKFMTIFSMLFGAGIVLMTRRREDQGANPRGIHYRRMGTLLLFGLMHAYLLWFGDILVLYAVSGSIVFFLRKRSPRLQLILGLTLLTVGSVLSLMAGLSLPNWPEEVKSDMARDFMPPPEEVAKEVATYRSGWLEQMRHRVPHAIEFQTFVFIFWGFWRAGGLMLVGMAFFSLGVFSAARSKKFYATAIAVAALIGIPIVSMGVRMNEQAGWSSLDSFFFGTQYNYWGSLFVSLGYVGAVMLVCMRPRMTALTRPFAAVGQMAFTNYIMHTVICTTLFYGHGFGLYGHVDRAGQIGIVFAVWALQLWYSPRWLRRFRYGPLEWLWRSLTYGRWEPFRREVPATN